MKYAKYILMMTMTLSSFAKADSLADVGGGTADFGQQINASSVEEDRDPAPDTDPCNSDNMEIRIEDYDAKTGTYEIVDTKCDGQGPWYSTPEVIGCAVPTLWMKTDQKLFLNKTVTLQKKITFHPVREEAREQGNSINAKTCKKRPFGGFFKKLIRGGGGGAA